MACSRLLPLLLVSACGWLDQPDTPAAPPRGADAAATPAPPPSTITVPLSIDLAELEEALQDRVPAVLLREEAKELEHGILADITVSRAGRVLAQGREDGRLRLVIPLKIRADAYHSLQVRTRRKPREDEPRKAPMEATLQLIVDLDLDISPDWHMLTKAKVHYRWQQQPVLTLGRITLDLTELLDAQLDAQLPDIADRIEARLREKDRLPLRIAVVWEKLSGSRPLPKPDNAWLLIEPTALYVSTPAVSGAALRMTAGMTGTVRTILGEEPSAPSLPLPPRSAPPGEDDGLRLGVDAVLAWETLSEQATAVLKGQQWALKISGAETGTLTVTGLELYPSGSQVAVGVDYTATSPLWDSAGTLWLTGTPALDVDAQRVSITDFDYAVATEDMAISGANAEAIKERIKEQVRDNLTFPFGERIDEQLALANEQLAALSLPNGGSLSAQVSGAEVQALHLTDAALAIRLELRGTAQLRLPPPRPIEELEPVALPDDIDGPEDISIPEQ